VEREGSLPCSPVHATGPHPKPEKCSQCPHVMKYITEMQIGIVLSCTPRSHFRFSNYISLYIAYTLVRATQLKVVTTNNYNTIADFHISQITTR
jgi:hypothetical protein